MNSRRILTALLWGALFAVAISIPTNDRRFSIEVWFTVFAIWTMGAVGYRLLTVSPMSSTSEITLWQRLAALFTKTEEETSSLLGPRSAQNLMHRAVASDRAHSRHLRPRLQQLASFYLPIRHGIDPERQPEPTQHLLGPLHWMIDDSVIDRRPTIEELTSFFDIVIGPTDQQGLGEH